MTVTADPGPAPAPVAPARPTRKRGRQLLHGNRTRTLGLIVALVVLFFVVLASLAIGSKPIPFRRVLEAITDRNDARDADVIIWSLRVPRTILGILVGVALGLAGALMQGVTRNPLADPGILGVEAGAALMVVIAISIFGVDSLTQYVWFAFFGAGVVAVFVYGLGSLGREGATPVKLALAGAAVSAMLSSITAFILLSDLAALDQFRFWEVGSIAGRGPVIVAEVAPFIIFGTVMALAAGRVVNALSLGDDVARSLGQRVVLSRAFAASAVVLLCGAATAAAGPIAFVGLVVPHIARSITGPDYRWILPYSAVLAGILLLGSDIIGRVVARPGELQVGIVTALIGAPFFVALARSRKVAEL